MRSFCDFPQFKGVYYKASRAFEQANSDSSPGNRHGIQALSHFRFYCRNSLVSSPMPSIATVTVLTGSFMTPTSDRRSAGDQIAGQQGHVVRDLAIDAFDPKQSWRGARGSQFSLPCVPVPLKIDDQLIAKMQECLLEGVRCQIPA